MTNKTTADSEPQKIYRKQPLCLGDAELQKQFLQDISGYLTAK